MGVDSSAFHKNELKRQNRCVFKQIRRPLGTIAMGGGHPSWASKKMSFVRQSGFETAFEVIIDESHGLHEGVAGGGADEGPAALFEVLTEGL